MRRLNKERLAGLEEARRAPRIPVKTVTFRKVHSDIPTRKSYTGTFPRAFWAKFTKRSMGDKPRSWISAQKLREVANRVGYKDLGEVEKIAKILEEGAVLGARGSARMGTKMKNAPSCAFYGERVIDSLQDWLDQDLVAGPFTKEELCQHFDWDDVTVNPIGVRLKSNGKARIIGEERPRLTNP